MASREATNRNIRCVKFCFQKIYTMSPFPFPHLSDLREKYTYNITPFSAAMSTGGQRSKKGQAHTIVQITDELLMSEVLV